MLIGAYCIIILPHIYQGIRNSMHAVNMPMLLEAAEMLGASKLYAFFRVIVPNIITGITVSSLLAVGILFGDYVIIRNHVQVVRRVLCHRHGKQRVHAVYKRCRRTERHERIHIRRAVYKPLCAVYKESFVYYHNDKGKDPLNHSNGNKIPL